MRSRSSPKVSPKKKEGHTWGDFWWRRVASHTHMVLFADKNLRGALLLVADLSDNDCDCQNGQPLG